MTDLSTFPPQPYVDDDRALGEQITLLAGQLNVGNYQLLKLIATFDNRKAWSGGGTIRSCAHWLNWRCGIALGAAREKVRVAHCLETLPLIDASFSRGEISYSKVRAMSRVATPENEDYLLTIAQFGTASHVEKVVGKYKNTTCADEDQPENDQQEARKLVYYQDEDGSWIIHAKLPAEAGSLVVKAIEAVAAPIQQKQQDLLIEQRKQQEESARKNVSAETSSTLGLEDPDGLQNSYIQTRADALISVAEHFLATSDQSMEFQGLKGSERCQIMLHVDINTLRQPPLEQHPHEGYSGQTHCNLDNKQWISPKTAKRLACDATLVTVLEDENGKVLNIGRRSRTVPASIKRALSLRDTSCRVPGCCQTKSLDAHHIQHWIDGGETSLDNLVQLCRHHHTQLHQGLFSIRVESTETMEEPHMIFLTPSGKRIEASFFPQFPEHSTENALAASAPQVDAKTCVTQWRGESCDYGVAVEALLRRDGRQN
jgi:hypothetical protein